MLTMRYSTRRTLGGGIMVAKQEDVIVEAFMPKPGFQSLLWHNGHRSIQRNKLDHRDTKGKWKQITDCRHEILRGGLQINTHLYYLHISWPCFCYRMTNISNGTLVKWRVILETSTRWIVVTLLDFVPTMINGSWTTHTHTVGPVSQCRTFSEWTQGGVAHSAPNW